MKRSKTQWIVSILLSVAALALLVMGLVGFLSRDGQTVQSLMEKMRAQAVLGRAAGSIIEQGALDTRRTAREYADTQGYSRNQRAAYVTEQEEIYRQEAQGRLLSFTDAQRQEIAPGIVAVEGLMREYGEQYIKERETYAQQWREEQAQKTPEAVPEGEISPAAAEGSTGGEDAALVEEVVDYSGFVASELLVRREAAIRPAYDAMFDLIHIAGHMAVMT